MIENITIGQIGAIVAFVWALGKGLDYLLGLLKKPAEDVEDKIGRRLDKIEADNKMTLKVVYTLLQHEVTGDHANDMDKLYTEVSNYIIDK